MTCCILSLRGKHDHNKIKNLCWGRLRGQCPASFQTKTQVCGYVWVCMGMYGYVRVCTGMYACFRPISACCAISRQTSYQKTEGINIHIFPSLSIATVWLWTQHRSLRNKTTLHVRAGWRSTRSCDLLLRACTRSWQSVRETIKQTLLCFNYTHFNYQVEVT